MSPNSLPKTNPDVLFTELNDGTGVLLHLQTKFYFTLNATGVLVWKSLAEGNTSEEAIAAALSHAFRVDAETAARDVSTMLTELSENELLIPTR